MPDINNIMPNINGKDIGFLYPNHLDVDSNKIVYDIVKEWMDQVG